MTQTADSFGTNDAWATVMASFTAVLRSPNPESVAVLADELAGILGAGHVALAGVGPQGELRAVRRDDADLIHLVESSGAAAGALASGAAAADGDRVVLPVLDEGQTVGALVIDGEGGELDVALVARVAELCGWVLGRQLRNAEQAVQGARDAQRVAESDRDVARGALRVAETDRDAARRAQDLAERARALARRAQEVAESDRDDALDALELAEAARDVARRAQDLAESDRDVAHEALEIAETARDLALLDRDESVEDARLNAETAAVLVRTVLPKQLPASAGVSLAAHYAPATTTRIVGGDWYDAMTLPDGRLFCSVGDATGHGLPAATVMGRLANAARVAALIDPAPSAVLAVLDQTLRSDDSEALATALVAVYDPAQRSLRWARAGHTPPVVCRPGDGTAIVEPRGWPPLGVPAAATVAGLPPEHEMHLPPGSVCALFTDGLVERRGEHLDRGLERLSSAVAAAHGSGDAERIVAHIVEACGTEQTEDDVCLLVLAVS